MQPTHQNIVREEAWHIIGYVGGSFAPVLPLGSIALTFRVTSPSARRSSPVKLSKTSGV
jgi:hypothetical protein